MEDRILDWGWSMAVAIIGVLWTVLLTVVGVLHRQNEKRLENLDSCIAMKADKEDVSALKADLDEVYERARTIEIATSRMETNLAANAMRLEKIDNFMGKMDHFMGLLVDRRRG